MEYIGVSDASSGVPLKGRIITIINRSEIVGRPLAALLSNDGATVYSVDLYGIQCFVPSPSGDSHHKVIDCDAQKVTLDSVLALSDIIISAVPTAEFKIDAAKKCNKKCQNLVFINVSSHPNIDTSGFAGETDGSDSSDKVTFVPSVGKVTISMLLRNLARLAAATSV